MPCIGRSDLDFQFYNSDVAINNLGGMGPNTDEPPVIRYVNVGSSVVESAPAGPDGTKPRIRFDLEVTKHGHIHCALPTPCTFPSVRH